MTYFRTGKNAVDDLSFNSNENLAPVRFVTVMKKGSQNTSLYLEEKGEAFVSE